VTKISCPSLISQLLKKNLSSNEKVFAKEDSKVAKNFFFGVIYAKFGVDNGLI
jgi:hypothetical protein